MTHSGTQNMCPRQPDLSSTGCERGHLAGTKILGLADSVVSNPHGHCVPADVLRIISVFRQEALLFLSAEECHPIPLSPDSGLEVPLAQWASSSSSLSPLYRSCHFRVCVFHNTPNILKSVQFDQFQPTQTSHETAITIQIRHFLCLSFGSPGDHCHYR